MTPKKRSDLPRMKPRMRAPLRLLGSKGKLARYLLPMIPRHVTYVEVFGGGAALLFAKNPLISGVEVINDLDQGIVNFFRVLRNPLTFEKFVKQVRLTPYSRMEWKDSVDSWREEEDLATRAAKWFVIARQSFGGKFAGSWGFASASTSKSTKHGYLPMQLAAWLNVLEALPEFHWRLSRVQIENVTWQHCLKLYNQKGTFAYLDPPYIHSTRRAGTYEHELSDDQHIEMVQKLLEYRGMAMLSGYPHDIYKPLEEAGWSRTEFDLQVDVAGSVRQSRRLLGKGAKQAKKFRRLDCVWRNPACVRNTPKRKDDDAPS